MKNISIYREFGIDDLASTSVVNELINKLDFGNFKRIEIDLRDCFIDYPFTSKIVDRALYHLKNIDGEKNLSIIYDLNAKEGTLLNWFFLESEFLEITNNEKSMDLQIIKDRIQSKLRNENMKIKIVIQYSENSEVLNTYQYE
jgi:hypothetical protein